jgi:hypothetical protein
MQSRTSSWTSDAPEYRPLEHYASRAAEWTREFCDVVQCHATQSGYAVFNWVLLEGNRAMLFVTITNRERGQRLVAQMLRIMRNFAMNPEPTFEIWLNYVWAVRERAASFDIGSLVFERGRDGICAAYLISRDGRRPLSYRSVRHNEMYY